MTDLDGVQGARAREGEGSKTVESGFGGWSGWREEEVMPGLVQETVSAALFERVFFSLL